MAHDVFISYSNKDKTIADAVCSKLEDQKIRAWIAPRDVPPGMDFAESIIDAIDACKAFVLIWSEDSNKSGHILNEVNRAFSRDITVIPFRIDNVQPTKSLEYYIGRTHWLDAMTPPLEKHIETLLDTILNLLGRKKEIKHIVAPEKEIVKKETPVTEGLKDEKEIIAPQKKLPVGLFIGAFIVMAIISVFVLTNQNQSRSSQIPSANAQFPTGTAKNIAPPPTETAKESGDIIKEAGGWPLVLSDSFDSKEQSIANGWMAGPWDDKNGFGDWMILPFADKGVYRLEVTSNSENYYSLSELPITYDQNFYLSVDVKHVSGPEDAAVGVYCKTEGEF